MLICSIFFSTIEILCLLRIQTETSYRNVEQEAMQIAQEIGAEYWAVSSKTGMMVLYTTGCIEKCVF